MDEVFQGKMNDALFSSAKQDWETPRALFATLNDEFDFELDPCSSASNAKCCVHFTEEEDGLTKSWGGLTAFVNPPYGRAIKHWVQKSHEESYWTNSTTVMLIPARTDTTYWHDYVMRASEIRLIRGRLHFEVDGVPSKVPAPFPSAIVVFDGKNPSELKVSSW